MQKELEQHFLLKCACCGKSFFTEGEMKFYQSKGLALPKRCRECREKIKNQKRNINNIPNNTTNKIDIDLKSLYEEILEHWSVEAKQEDKRYFYNINEVNIISEGKKSFVIARKGSGKTAIAQHLYEIDEHNVFAEKLSFKNFPFNILYSLDNKKEYTAPNQYISIWKYLIYSCICKKMILNENIDCKIRNQLSSIYGDTSNMSLERLIEQWTSKSFGATILGFGFNYGREKKEKEATWIDSIEILQEIILKYCDVSKYFVIFDELDEDYKDFKSEEEANNYMCMLTSLFKAVQDIKSIFNTTGKKILPVVFLRSDIYSRIKDSDKNKWHESIIDLEWNGDKIQRMLAHRLCVAANISNIDFDTIWYTLFAHEKVKMGNRQAQQMDIFPYIERSTEMRPRDFVQYVKECVKLANSNSEMPISAKTVKDADDLFSEYLKRETIDETFAVLPEINEILGLLSTIRKQSFQFSNFEHEYNELVERGIVPKKDVKNILLTLFESGVLGNKPTMRGKSIFRFYKNSPRFNFKETMIVHRGLYKALQIY